MFSDYSTNCQPAGYASGLHTLLSIRLSYDDADIDTFFFNASFNIEKIKIAEQVYGFRLTMETDKPYAYGETEKYTFDIKRTHLLNSVFAARIRIAIVLNAVPTASGS